MKSQLLLICLLALSLCTSAQTKLTQKYVAASVSITNGNDLGLSTYAMVEFGISYKNVSFGIGGGRGDLKFPEKDNMIFLEPKTSVTFYDAGFAKCYGIAGVGGYFFRTTPHYFIEYGAGFIIPGKKYDTSMQYSTWDGSPFISLGISRTL